MEKDNPFSSLKEVMRHAYQVEKDIYALKKKIRDLTKVGNSFVSRDYTTDSALARDMKHAEEYYNKAALLKNAINTMRNSNLTYAEYKEKYPDKEELTEEAKDHVIYDR